MHIILYVFRPFNGFYGCIWYILPITYCLMQKHTPGMFLTDFHMRKYTGGIISWVGIFLTVTPASPRLVRHQQIFQKASDTHAHTYRHFR